ncbi:MAG: histidinol-phosphate transaminase [Flavobacteriia bacterium]|nr:histidinol-phosphate transaminase [Flavobacteriia bacterium]OJX37660.1 MAG: histidinol-phosphate transaminase [Flavobacteriia bacterium 40-80]
MIQQLVRKNIRNLVPYSSARDEFKGNDAVFLDANENPFGKLNRYPDPYQRELKFLLSEEKNIPENNIFIGNGSDEVIDLTLRIFCEPQQDKILICPPTYGMYEVSADINNIKTIKVPLTDDFQLDIPTVLERIKTEPVKVVFLCSPNNPTGNSLNDIDVLLEKFNGIVVVDEAYIDFSERQSYLRKIKDYPNLIVSQTFSKAWGLAGARVGLAYATEEIIAVFNRVKPPYNISQLNQQAAIETLKNKPEFKQNLTTILSERKRLADELQQLDFIQKIYATDANFILVKIPDATEVYQQLVCQRIITRNRSSVISDCIRITIGTPEENDLLINELKKHS